MLDHLVKPCLFAETHFHSFQEAEVTKDHDITVGEEVDFVEDLQEVDRLEGTSEVALEAGKGDLSVEGIRNSNVRQTA